MEALSRETNERNRIALEKAGARSSRHHGPDPVIWALGTMGGVLLRVLQASWHWCRVEGVEHLLSLQAPFIFAFWHGEQAGMPALHSWIKRHHLPSLGGVTTLVSRHRDGRIVAYATALQGMRSVAGSSSRGAIGATRRLLRELQAGRNVGITPDGPRGPARIAKPGVIALGQISGAPIIPVAFAAERGWRMKSWDSFLIPKPFSRIAGVIGTPIIIARDLSEAEHAEIAHTITHRLSESSLRARELINA